MSAIEKRLNANCKQLLERTEIYTDSFKAKLADVQRRLDHLTEQQKNKDINSALARISKNLGSIIKNRCSECSKNTQNACAGSTQDCCPGGVCIPSEV